MRGVGVIEYLDKDCNCNTKGLHESLTYPSQEVRYVA
jgi:hypothetical protein